MGRIKKLERNLQGSRSVTLPLGEGIQNAESYRDVELDGDALDGVPCFARVECRVNSGESITPYVWNVTDDVAAGTGAVCVSQAEDYSEVDQVQTFEVTLASGLKKYRLRGDQTPGVTGAFLIGNLEIGDPS